MRPKPALGRVWGAVYVHATTHPPTVSPEPPTPQVYTWLDAHLRELTEILQEVYPSARNHHARLSFAFVYPDRRGRNVMRQVGRGQGRYQHSGKGEGRDHSRRTPVGRQ